MAAWKIRACDVPLPLKNYLTMRSAQHFIWIILLSLAFAQASEKPPNIVFLFTDDHAVQAISAYGSKINKTPNIDRIAAEGAIFRNSFCTNSICGPSRAAILTGKHSHMNGFLRNSDRFDGSQQTFPKLLQTVGYQTAVIGKWHLGSTPQGFNYWEILPGQGHYYNPDFIQMDGTRKRYTGYSSDIVTDRATEWLGGLDKTKPFLLMLQFKAPHRGWAPAPRHLQDVEEKPIPKPETFHDRYQGRTSLLKDNKMTVSHHMHWGHDMKFHGKNRFPEHFVSGMANDEYKRMTDEQKKIWDSYYAPRNEKFIQDVEAGKLSTEQIVDWKFQRYMTDYLKCVASVDENVGRIREYLEKHGLADNTIIIYSSDQGFYLGEHGWYDKRWMFEESLKMPFMIRWPGVVKPGTQPEAMIQNIDYAPTFLEAAGVPIPSDIQGRSMLPILKNDGPPTPEWRDAIYYGYHEDGGIHNVPAHDGIRTDRYKLMFFPKTSEWQLFDLIEDPNELKSVHENASYAPVFKEMRERYTSLRESYSVNSTTIPASRGEGKKRKPSRKR